MSEADTRAHAQMNLCVHLYPTGYHVAAWRHPDVPADAGTNFGHFVDLAQRSEAAKFDFVFLADSLTTQGSDIEALSRTAVRYVSQFEPFTLLAGLAATTRRIGLVASATTTYNEPYHIARKFASLDHMSGGRSGWNVVTSQNESEAPLFGLDAHPDHALRYERAREFTDVVKKLWNCWDEDAFPRDKASGVFFDARHRYPVSHAGRYFKVNGVLNLPRSPQGRPIIVQAGSSDAGRDLCAETADIVFTAQPDFATAKAFHDDVKRRMERFGRAPDRMKVLVGVFPFVGRTEQEAIEKFEALQALVHPVVGLSLLGGTLGSTDLSRYPVDGPLPPLPETNAGKSRQKLLLDMAARENLSIRQLYLRFAGGRGHWHLVGSAQQVADQLEQWFREGAADGFNIMPPAFPWGLQDFIDLVLPELRRRGLFRSEYSADTLRGHLQLADPETNPDAHVHQHRRQ